MQRDRLDRADRRAADVDLVALDELASVLEEEGVALLAAAARDQQGADEGGGEDDGADREDAAEAPALARVRAERGGLVRRRCRRWLGRGLGSD